MSDFLCARCSEAGRDPVGTAPFPDDRGRRIAGEICTVCWDEWKKRQMLLINHYGLNVRDPKAREFLYDNLDGFLFGTGDVADVDVSKQGEVSW